MGQTMPAKGLIEPSFGCKCFVTQFNKVTVRKTLELNCEELSCSRRSMSLGECCTSSLPRAWACDVTALMGICVGWSGGTSALEIWGIYPFQKEYYFTEVPLPFFHVFREKKETFI